MKLEKINDNQFRCILTQGELLKRHLTVKKLAEGHGEVRQLIREMLEQSYDELGFTPNEFPLMIEAQPTKDGNLALTITKVNHPGQLPPAAAQQELSRVLQRIIEMAQKGQTPGGEPPALPTPFAVFAFDDSERPLLPPTLTEDPTGVHTVLYHAPRSHQYLLTVSSVPKYSGAFCRVCHLLSEYARTVAVPPSARSYYQEHYRTVFSRNALRQLASGADISRS